LLLGRAVERGDVLLARATRVKVLGLLLAADPCDRILVALRGRPPPPCPLRGGLLVRVALVGPGVRVACDDLRHLRGASVLPREPLDCLVCLTHVLLRALVGVELAVVAAALARLQ